MNLRYLMHRYGYIADSDEKQEEKEPEYKKGEFGNIYTQFNGDIEGAVEFLKKVKNGECVNVLHRLDIGFVSLIWGEKGYGKRFEGGYGLNHILAKHEEELKQLGLSVEDVISYVFENGELDLKELDKYGKILIKKDKFLLVIKVDWNKDELDNPFILTIYDLRSVKEKEKIKNELKKREV